MKGWHFLWSGAWLCAALTSAVAADGQPCKLTRVANLPMKIDSAGRPAIDVTLNGVTKLFLINSAGIYSSVAEESLPDFNLKIVPLFQHPISLMDGTLVNKIAYPDSLLIGNLRIPTAGYALAVIPPGHTAPGDAGSISPDILRLFDVEFDFAAARFELFMPSDCGDQVVHWTHAPHAVLPFQMSHNDFHIVTRAKLDGKDVDVIVDTGSTTAFMSLDDAKDIIPGGQDKNLKPLPGNLPLGPQAYTYPFKTLTLGDITVDNPVVILEPSIPDVVGTMGKIRPVMILGASALQQLHLYISYKEKKIYVTNASTH